MKERKTYHLYHHYPDPLPPGDVADRAWLINNAAAYSLVATVDAASATEALQAAQFKAQERRVPRLVKIQAGNLLRETRPGDVLVAEYAAWMVDPAHQLRPLAYCVSRPYKHLQQRSGQQAAVDTLAWSSDGQVVAASASDRRVVLHVVNSEEPYRQAYERGAYSVTSLVWSPCGDRLASAYAQGEVHLWKPAPWQTHGSIGSILVCRTEEATSFSPLMRCLAWSPDGLQIVAGRDDGCLVGWDTRTGACLPRRQHHAKPIMALAFSPRCEHLLLTASADASARIWNCATDQEIVYQHTEGITAAAWSPDGTLVASCEHADPTIHLWHPQTGALVERLPLSISSTKGLEVCSLAWSPDGTYLAAGCDDSTVQLVHLALHQHVQTYRVNAFYRRRVVALAWSPESTRLAAGDGDTGTDIWLVDQDLAQANRQAHAVPEEQKPTNLSLEVVETAL